MTKKEIKQEYKNKKKIARKEYRANLSLAEDKYKGALSEAEKSFDDALSEYYRTVGKKQPINPPKRSVLEEIGNAITHGLGAVFAIVAFILMLMQSDTPSEIASAIIKSVEQPLYRAAMRKGMVKAAG